MALLDIRQRTGFLFLALAVGHILLISAQVNTKRGVPILEAVTFGLVSEVQRGISSVVNGVRQGWTGYVALRGVRAENETLKSQLAAAEVQIQEQRALADRTRGLQRLLDLQQSLALDTAAADIIASSATPDFQTVTIDKGTLQRLSRDMAVVAPAGIVGRVVVASPRASKVQLLIDRNAAAGALVERSRAQGVVVGAGDGRLRMDYVSEVADVAVGDAVVTSGIDGIYPRGFVIGHVETVEKSGGAYRRITVRPAVDFTRLEEVLVVLTPSPARQASEAPQ
jgi:rod shape-determining protein MreC